MAHEEPEGYEGEVTVAVDGTAPVRTTAALAARFDPLAGALVWTGRIAVPVAARARIEVGTPYGVAPAEATERDPWGNTRVRGTGRPPFPVELLDAADPVGG